MTEGQERVLRQVLADPYKDSGGSLYTWKECAFCGAMVDDDARFNDDRKAPHTEDCPVGALRAMFGVAPATDTP